MSFVWLISSLTNNKYLTGIELKDVQEKLQRETNSGTSLAQSVQKLESELRWATSKAEELEGALAGSRSEREKLSTSLKATEAGSFLRFLLHGCSIHFPWG